MNYIEEVLLQRDLKKKEEFRDWLSFLATATDDFPMIEALLKLKILDVGCGAGYLVRQMLESDLEVYGIDRGYGDHAVPCVPEIWSQFPHHERFSRCNTDHLPFVDNFFGIVTSSYILDCGEPNYEELHRVIQEKGVLFMVDSSLDSDYCPLRAYTARRTMVEDGRFRLLHENFGSLLLEKRE